MAFLLTDSSGIAAGYLKTLPVQGLGEVRRLNGDGRSFFARGDYSAAHASFLSAVAAAEQIGDRRDEALNWNNAGSCSLHAMQFRTALDELTRSREIATEAREPRPLSFALNSLASLYLTTGQPERALAIGREALASAAVSVDSRNRSRLECEMGEALMQTHRPKEALEYYRDGLNGLLENGDLDGAARAWGMYCDDSLREGNLDDAERACFERLRLVRLHHLPVSANLFSGLARVRQRKGDLRGAEEFFAAALKAPPGPTPLWRTYSDRGRFNLDRGHLPEALADFRKARAIASSMRADMVPTDLDRVNFENGLSQFLEGLIDAGNRLALSTNDEGLLAETFDAAEQDRLWSLRALVPSADDWRARLPGRYWELLARYQAAQRDRSAKTAALQDELRQIEVEAAANSSEPTGGSAIARVRETLDPESVLISFHLSRTSSWVWAATADRIDAFPLPPLAEIQREASNFTNAIRSGADFAEAGERLYRDLFGRLPHRYLARSNWRLELDGPLYDVPFAALVVSRQDGRPVYLIERTSIESVPGALLLTKGVLTTGGRFLGIGDPIYNSADPRFRGARSVRAGFLPRLPNTATEVSACARTWNSTSTEILSGAGATSSSLVEAFAAKPEIIHFATHVVSEPGEFRSGLIALSLGTAGTMDLLGPKEIVARRNSAKLVVMNGCHSAQGQTLAGAGLMGLTRAWIGSGAFAVMATQWDVPDNAAQSIMTAFYSSLRSSPEQGLASALRQAEMGSIASGGNPADWPPTLF